MAESTNIGDSKMKIIVEFWVRHYPQITINKLEKLEGTGTAFVTELIRNKKGDVLCSTRGFKRLFDYDELVKAAQANYDVIYKTASLSRCSKFYAPAEAVEKLNLILY